MQAVPHWQLMYRLNLLEIIIHLVMLSIIIGNIVYVYYWHIINAVPRDKRDVCLCARARIVFCVFMQTYEDKHERYCELKYSHRLHDKRFTPHGQCVCNKICHLTIPITKTECLVD